MPACTSENISRRWSSSPPISRSSSVSPLGPSTPLSTSPPLVSPISTLKRSMSNISNASNPLDGSPSSNSSDAPTVIFSPRRRHRHQHQRSPTSCQAPGQTGSTQGQNHNRNDSLLVRILTAYIGFLFGIVQGVVSVISYAIWAPALWASVWVYMIWVIFQLPLTALKWFITVLHTPASERARNKRCVLISGGSTVQAVHLARNFYKAGARVVICELEGLFGLAKFSTACSKFYTIPKPGPGNVIEYITALRDIVQKEKAAYYIPVSATNTAYYDALAKTYLEVMGCQCFVPGASEVAALDDTMELLRRCRALGLATPSHTVLRSAQDVARLYEQNALSGPGRYLMLPAGPAGMRDRTEVVLPPTAREFLNQQHEISESKPWAVIRDPNGKHYVTCTTVKESRIVANVTCLVDEERGLIPEERPEVARWLERFFSRTFGSRINGHLSFRLAVSEGELVPIGCRVGVSLPYICHTGIHPRLVWKPCRHFSRQNSGILSTTERHTLPDVMANLVKRQTETEPHLLGTVLDKREALFTYWDPLPYCAYYHLQLPFRRLAGMIRAQPAQHNPPLAVVQ
ncbi:uncharacterized protein LOC128889141 [Hylaeus anthracinus]|uniref:uncharacterized protein LOC128889141 n=1 Tax=Hylaeus anthracinus TaxID=313031 RepID=UPI0023BA1246|nr:uncharacterized protein LOC128889141 [Hylaeus anthracinus]